MLAAWVFSRLGEFAERGYILVDGMGGMAKNGKKTIVELCFRDTPLNYSAGSAEDEKALGFRRSVFLASCIKP